MVDVNEMPKTLGFGIDLQVPHLSSLEVNHVHVTFNLNGILTMINIIS
jgi:hypothetical protein